MSGKVVKVSGPLVVATGLSDANMSDVVRVGPQRLIGEILTMKGDSASIQVYEETSGLGPGAEVAKETVRELAKDGDCAVIYLTEVLAKDMEDVLSRYKDDLRPAIILIPGREGSLGIGRDNIQRAIERAVGADIL